jgi:serine-type D-Ala-D-Ala carboxypeptidase
MSSSPLAVVESLLDKVVGNAPVQGPTGAVMAIRSRGVVRCWARGSAQARGEEGSVDPVAVTAETVFDIGSVTKVVATVASLLRLYDAGGLDLDASVRRFRPAFADGAKGEVTIRQVLQHRAGMWEWWPLYLSAQDRKAALDLVDRLPLRYAPGTSRHYSDLGFMLLGSVVEQVAGAQLDEAVSSLVLEPLDMRSTGYAGPWLEAHRVAATSRGDQYEAQMIETGLPYPVPRGPAGFSFARRHVLRGEANDGNAFHAFGGVAGHAGLFSTAGDLCRLGAALVAGDGSGSFCSTEAMAEFAADGPDEGQALGFRTRRVGRHRVVEHPGFPGAFWALDVDAGVCVTLLTNRLHPQSRPVPLDEPWSHLLNLALDSCVEEGESCALSE